jgi:hypothetical protein
LVQLACCTEIVVSRWPRCERQHSSIETQTVYLVKYVVTLTRGLPCPLDDGRGLGMMQLNRGPTVPTMVPALTGRPTLETSDDAPALGYPTL